MTVAEPAAPAGVTTAAPPTTAGPTVVSQPPRTAPSGPVDWGPLFVYPGENFRGGEGLRGVISIGEECVTLSGPDGGLTFVPAWPDDRTRWDPEHRAVVIEGFALQDGDEAAFGGLMEDLPSRWVVPPRPEYGGMIIALTEAFPLP